MRLFGFWRSTATWRVRIALAHKGVSYEYVPVHLARDGGEQHRPEFVARNPMRHVPVLELPINGTVRHLAESMAILEYLEEAIPSPRLLPKDPYLRARARQLALLVVSGIQPLQNTKVQRHVANELAQDGHAWITRWVVPGLEALETLTRETAGTYSVGDDVSFADVCLVPQLYFARRFGIDVEGFATLSRIERACAGLEAFAHAHAERQIDAEASRAAPSPYAVVEKALAMTAARLAHVPEGNGVHAMLASLQNQLVFMRDVIAEGRSPTTAEKNGLSLHVIAVREYEQSDPPYCDALSRAAYAFKGL